MGQSIGAPRAHVQPGDRQPPATTRNDSQVQRGQRDFGGVCEVGEPVFIDMRLVRMCRDELDAINLCIDLSRLPDEAISAQLSIDKGHWSRMRHGRAHFPTAKRLALMRLAGNWAPLQYEMDRAGVLERLRAEFSRPQHSDGFAEFAGRAA